MRQETSHYLKRFFSVMSPKTVNIASRDLPAILTLPVPIMDEEEKIS